MTKIAAIKPTNTTRVEKVRAGKRAFFVSLFDLSWRLLGAMLAPLFVGLYIDSKRGHGQAFALAGFAIGMVCGALALKSVVSKIAKNQGDIS